MSVCKPCKEPLTSTRISDEADFCEFHKQRLRQIRQEDQPKVWRRKHPRCPECNHNPRLLEQLFHMDAWICRWGHIIPSYDLWRLEHGN